MRKRQEFYLDPHSYPGITLTLGRYFKSVLMLNNEHQHQVCGSIFEQSLEHRFGDYPKK